MASCCPKQVRESNYLVVRMKPLDFERLKTGVITNLKWGVNIY